MCPSNLSTIGAPRCQYADRQTTILCGDTEDKKNRPLPIHIFWVLLRLLILDTAYLVLYKLTGIGLCVLSNLSSGFIHYHMFPRPSILRKKHTDVLASWWPPDLSDISMCHSFSPSLAICSFWGSHIHTSLSLPT